MRPEQPSVAVVTHSLVQASEYILIAISSPSHRHLIAIDRKQQVIFERDDFRLRVHRKIIQAGPNGPAAGPGRAHGACCMLEGLMAPPRCY